MKLEGIKFPATLEQKVGDYKVKSKIQNRNHARNHKLSDYPKISSIRSYHLDY